MALPRMLVKTRIPQPETCREIQIQDHEDLIMSVLDALFYSILYGYTAFGFGYFVAKLSGLKKETKVK